jgi:hypothetical protein
VDEGVTDDSSSFRSVKEVFESCLPFYLSIGMSAVEFWEGEPSLAVAYRKADEIKRENMNFAAWLSGVYVYRALLCASPLFHDFIKGDVKPIPYDEPIALTEATKQRKEEKAKELEEKKAQDDIRTFLEGLIQKQKQREEEQNGRTEH